MNIQNPEFVFDQLKQRVIQDMAHFHIPGVALGVLFGDETFTASFGVTSLDHPLDVDEDTLFQIGSITKTITALAVMRLVEQGQLDLDAPVKRYLPELRLADESVAERVTLRQLFSHTGGWLGDYFHDLGSGDDALQRIVEQMANLPQEAPLGSVYSYNNAAFYLAGRVLEVATGKTYERAATELALQPLGMDHSFFFPGDVMTYRFVVGHDAVYAGDNRQPEVQRPWALARTGNPVGGLACSLRDLLRYAHFQMGDGAPLLSLKTLAEMHRPTVRAANDEHVGVAWFIRDVGGVKVIRHGGGTNGQQATFQVAPEKKFTFVALTNSDRGSEMYTPLVRQALAHFLGAETPVSEPQEWTMDQMEEIAGWYQGAANDMELRRQSGNLMLYETPKGGFPTVDSPPSPAPPAMRVARCGTDRLLILDEPRKLDEAEILRDASGQVEWLRIGGRVHRRGVK